MLKTDILYIAILIRGACYLFSAASNSRSRGQSILLPRDTFTICRNTIKKLAGVIIIMSLADNGELDTWGTQTNKGPQQVN